MISVIYRVAMSAEIGRLQRCSKLHLDAYTDPRSLFAYATYDRWHGNPDRLSPLDCLAANLLSLRLGHGDVIPLFASGGEDTPQTKLRAAMQRVLDETTAEDDFLRLPSIDSEPFTLVRAANKATEAVPGWTAVTVCKVLHRLRPRLVPVYDSVVRKFYGVPESSPGEFFRRFHQDLLVAEPWLNDLVQGRETPDGRPLSVLRAADIVIWHHQVVGGCGTDQA